MKKTHILFIFLFLLFIFSFLYYKEGEMPVNKNDKTPRLFIIDKGESLNSIANKLSNEGFIRNKVVFYLIVKKLGIEKNIQAGDFRLSKSMNASQLAQTLTHGTLDTWVTIIEGLRKEEIAQELSTNFKISEIAFIEQAKEGYLFPDTYLFPANSTIDKILTIINQNFNTKFTNDLKEKGRSKGLTERQILTIASLVEKEAKLPEDKQQVASIILKRHLNDWALDIDATVQYALGYQKKTNTWWKKDLTQEDLEADSQYNTRKYKGLPPAPICNPGLDSINAAVNADAQTPYWFYISDKTGKMHYAITIEEHNENIAKYLQ